MRIGPATPLEDILEKDWQTTVVDLARQLGFTTYHVFNARRSAFGWPDLMLVRDRLIAIELKREAGKPTDDQKAWIRKLLAAGVETYLVRPRDLQLLAVILAHRGDPYLNPGAQQDAAVYLRDQTRTEVTP